LRAAVLEFHGFRGTELFASLSDPGRYLLDRFTDEAAWRAFLTEHRGSAGPSSTTP
jgi:hypothetical protein